MKKILSCILFFALTTPLALANEHDPLISAWVPSWDFDAGSKSVMDNVDLFDEVSPFWYYLNPDGSIALSTGAENQDFVKNAHRAGIRVIPSITNSFKDELATQVMADETKRKSFVNAVMSIVKANSYDGFDIDFEGLKLANKENFVTLLKDLSTQLHSQNKFLTVAVQAKSADPGPWESLQAQDWKGIADAVDRFRIMAYDEHYSGGGAGAISSVPWIKGLLEFAKTQVPEEKLILGLPLYGYNWGEKQKAYAVTFKDMEYLLKRYKPGIQWDENGQEPFVEYEQEAVGAQAVDKRKSYFQNKDSISKKWELAKTYPLSGLVFWRLGGEDVSIWQYLREQKKAALKAGDFTDVVKEHWAYKYIQALRSRGLSQGVNNQFFPDKGLTRAEGLKIALTAGHIPQANYPVVSNFKDTATKDWFSVFAKTARARGIVSGQGDLFYPYKLLTRSEAVKIVLRSGGTKLAETISRPDEVITRAEFAKLVAVGFRFLSS